MFYDVGTMNFVKRCPEGNQPAVEKLKNNL
jgi:hypothetical protein